MKELEQRVLQILTTDEIVFREDLNITDQEVLDRANPTTNLKEIVTNLIGLVNTDKSRNTTGWLRNYVSRIYK